MNQSVNQPAETRQDLRSRCLEWISARGYELVHEDEDLIAFQDDALDYVFCTDPEKPNYLVMTSLCPTEEPCERLFDIANTLNRAVKMIKVVVDDDDDLDLSIEALLPEEGDISEFLDRFRAALRYGTLRALLLLKKSSGEAES